MPVRLRVQKCKEPWNNPKVREAVALALDIDGARHSVFRGRSKTPVSIVPPSIKYHADELPMPASGRGWMPPTHTSEPR